MLSESLRQCHVSAALKIFVAAKRMPAHTGDEVIWQYLELCERESVKQIPRNFSVKQDSLNHTLTEIMLPENCEVALQQIVQQILIMFQGYAAVERSFSFNKTFLVENLTEDSLISHKLVHDAILAHGGGSEVSITTAMIHSVRMAGTRRNECLKKKAEEKQNKAAAVKRIHKDKKQRRLLC